MQKKLLTLAVAAAMAAPAAAMAEATLYGKLNMSIDYADVDNAIGTYYADPDGDPAPGNTVYFGPNGNPIIRGGEDFKGWGISGNGKYMPGKGRANRIGVKGSEDLGNGLKAIYQVELGLNLSAKDNNIPSGSNGISYRNSFIGLAGNWGTFLVGRHDTPLKISTGKLDQFSDTMADYNGTVGFDDIRADNVIAYISPSFSGFSFAGAVVAGGGATAGAGANINEDSLAGAFSLAAIYNNGPFYASAAYESLDKDMFMNSATSLAGSGACFDVNGDPTLSCNYVGDSYDKWRFGLGLLDWNGFTLSAVYENQENLPGGQTRSAWTYIDADGTVRNVGVANGVEKQQLWQIQAGYAFGNNKVKAMYGAVDRNDDKILGATQDVVSLDNLRDDLEGDRNTWAIGFDHNFSKRSKAYVLYTAVDDDNNGIPGYGTGSEWSGFSVGMVHKF
jgi:predicted porin